VSSAEHNPPAPEGASPCPSCGERHQVGTPCEIPTRPGAGSTVALGSPSITPLPEAAVSVDPLVGSMVGSFRIVRLLGRGGMGTVYLAEHPVIGSKVAIKFLHEAMASNADLVGRFYDEARAVNLIGHENIVGIFDLNVLPPSRYYIVMEYLDGETLTSLLRAGPIEPRVTLDILLQLCDALHCAHGSGVVHRDLKPDNVFLLKRRGKSHFVKLVDFGIAKLRDAPAGAQHTAAGMIVGTPEYMAPEQCDNQPVDARTDLYALAVMAYEMATGQLPFSGRSIAQLLLAHLHEPPAAPRRLNPSIHPRFEGALLKALSKRPEDRFRDMEAFGAALSDVLDELSRPAAPQAAATSTAFILHAAPESTPAPEPSPPPPAGLEVEVQGPGDASARRLVASALFKGGVHVHAEGRLPALFSRLKVTLVQPPEPPLSLAAEVVRLVSPADAVAWKMPQGFSLQFVDVGAEQRAALARLSGEKPAGKPAPARPTTPRPEAADTPSTPSPSPADAAASSLLDDLWTRSSGDHYAFLGLAPDSDFVDVRARAKDLRSQIEALRGRHLPPDKAGRVGGLLDRLELASAVLGSPTERLLHDARQGNHAGVARCIATGLTAQVIAGRRREWLAERPGCEERAQKHLARARVARAMRNGAVAMAEYEAALADDPLDLAIHQAYWNLRREAAPAGAEP
jgi:eukaryotic-like serine/threonine-protein kinase